jgi:hypothetical protein
LTRAKRPASGPAGAGVCGAVAGSGFASAGRMANDDRAMANG